MKKFLAPTVLLATVSMAATLSAQTPKSDKEKLGYSLGVDVSQTLEKQPIEFDKTQFINAVRDTLTGAKPAMTDEQVKETLTNFSKDIQAKQQAQMAQARAAAGASSSKNKEAGAAFLAANKAKPGVQTLPDGLEYKVVTEGSGPMPKATDTVTVKYRGTTIDGKEFDASDKHGGTASFPVNGVIPGWTEALQKMKVGSTWQLYIPSDLAYADQGAGADIPPGSTLIFDVTLVSIGK